MKTIHLICNPVSGKGATNDALAKIKEWAKTQNDLDLQVHVTENVGHATIITKDLTSTGQQVNLFVIGGDGTLNEVLNGIDNFDNTVLGVLPFGSGNDFAFALGIKETDPVALFNKYLNNPVEWKIDYLLLNEKYRVINGIGIGLSAEVIAYRNKMKHFKPKTQYKIATVIKSLFWKSKKCIIQVGDAAPNEVSTLWLTINNGKRIGGSVITHPDSKLDDGLMSVMYVNKFNHIKTIHHLAVIKKGKIKSIKDARFFDAKELVIDLSDSVIEYDGCLLEHQNKITVRVIPNKLKVLKA